MPHKFQHGLLFAVITILQNQIMKVKASNPQTPSEKSYPLKIHYAAALPDSNLWLVDSEFVLFET